MGQFIKKLLTTVNIHSLNVGAPYFIKQTLIDIKCQRDPDTTTGGDFDAHPHLHTGLVTEKSE